MDSSRFTFLFHRYINGSSSEDEKQEFLILLSGKDHDTLLHSLMKDVWATDAYAQSLPKEKVEEIFNQVINFNEGTTLLVKKKSPVLWMTMAASVIGLAILVFYFQYQAYHATYAEVSAITALSEHRIIKLADGSIVKLNAGSTLTYPETFAGENLREVSLKGEAYFEVSHDETHPFIVHTGQLKTTVLGTAFNVKAYDIDQNITVTVTTGKVMVSKDESTLGIITPDQQIVFHKESEVVDKAVVNSGESMAWSAHDMMFDDITLSDAAKILEERFKVKIVFGNETKRSCRFTATFVRGENVDQILTVICEFNGAKLNRVTDGVYKIEGNGC